jgi:phospholipase C
MSAAPRRVRRCWIGDASFDARAGSLGGMLDLRGRPNTRPVLLDEATGAVVGH